MYIDRSACTEKTGVRFYRFAHGWKEIMKFGALATIGFTLVFGLPAASSFFVGIIVLTTPAQADIRCTRMGCRKREKQSDVTGVLLSRARSTGRLPPGQWHPTQAAVTDALKPNCFTSSSMSPICSPRWFDIPVVYNNNRRAILAIEKGTPGEGAFADAFKAWKQ